MQTNCEIANEIFGETKSENHKFEIYNDTISGVYYEIKKYAHPFKLIIENAKVRHECDYTPDDFITCEHIYANIKSESLKYDGKFYINITVKIGDVNAEYKKYFTSNMQKKETKFVSQLDFVNIEPIGYKFTVSKFTPNDCGGKMELKRDKFEITPPKITASWFRFNLKFQVLYNRDGHVHVQSYLRGYLKNTDKFKIISGDKYKIGDIPIYEPNIYDIWLPATTNMKLEILSKNFMKHDMIISVEIIIDAIII
jgi:hypothetical protein